MELKRFEATHYPELVEWWKHHNHPVIALTSLSPLGLIAENNGKLVAVSFLYVMHGCDLGQIAWTTSNPKSGLKERHQAINECILSLYEIAKLNKRNNVICFSSSSGLTKLIKKHGLNVGKAHDLLSGYMRD